MPATTASGVASTWKSSGTTPQSFNGPKINPTSPRMNFHWTVRITNDTKNGRRIRNKIALFRRPP